MKHSRRLLLSRATFSAFLLTTLSINFNSVKAAPTGAHVVSGSASVQQNGNVTTIKASNGSVINYNTFNVGPGQVVNFIQPSSSSRVMNRVTGSDPSRIFGMLEANGIVYLINPNGIYFQNGSMLNVGQLYAAGGHLSDQDFLNGKNRFTNMTGTVSNAGTMVASDSVHLLGEHVANFGSITAKTGAVVLASGSDILVGQRDGNVFVRANPSPASGSTAASGAAASTTPGVQNTGTIQAPRAIMGAGDMYSVAISNSGLIKSKHITVSGGQSGAVNVSGTLDASGRAASGHGGSISVTGQTVALQGATLDASGTNGGGTIKVGGGFHGQGPTPTSTQTTVDAATTIKADALSNGAGGKVVVWSNQTTNYAGSISAQGAGTGAGGSAEVSSKGTLSYTGTANLRGQNGTLGSLLLDPNFITITNSGTANTTLTSGQTLAFGDPPTISTITTANLAAALNGANVTLEANDDITFHDSLSAGSNASPGNLTLRAGRSIIFGDTAAVTISINGSLTATAGDSGATGVLAGTPAITMHSGSSIDTSGAGKNITLINNGGGMQLASLTTGTTSGTISLTATGAVSQTGSLITPNLSLTGTGSGSFNLVNSGNSVGSLTANVTGALTYANSTTLGVAGITGTAGAVSLQAPTLNINGAIQTGTGNLTLTASAAVNQSAAISGAGLELEGGGLFKLTNPNNSFTTIASGATGGVSYVNKGALTVGTVNFNGINSGGTDVSLQATDLTISSAIQTGTGNLTLTASSSVVQNAGGVISGTGLELEGAGKFNLTNAGNTFKTLASRAMGSVSYVNNGALIVGSVNVDGIVTNGNVGLEATDITFAKSVQTGTGNLVLDASGTVSENTGITISGNGLALQGAGTFNLTNANNFTTIASVATGLVNYVNSAALTVGSVVITSDGGTMNGINTTGNVSLSSTDLTIAAGIKVGNLLLNASGTVSQNAGITITGTGLALEGAGTFNLANANTVTNFASAATGPVTYVNSGALTVGSVTVGTTTTNGIDTTGDVSLSATNITIAKSIQVGNLALDASGTVSENNGITIGGGGLALKGAGTFNLTNANDFTTIASGATGLVSYVNNAALTVGSVTVNGTTTNGISTTGDVSLSATDLTIANTIQVGNLMLTASGTVSENSGVTIGGTGLVLAGAGTFNLTNANSFTTIASGATGPVSYVNSGALTVGSVTLGGTTTNGITSNGGDVSLQATTIAIANSVNVGSGNLVLNSSSSVKQTASISGSGLELSGAGTVTLNDAGNTFKTIASNATGVVSYTNSRGLTVGVVNITGIDSRGAGGAGGADVTLNAPVLDIADPIQVGTGNLVLNVSGTTQQESAISGTGLELLGGQFTLSDSANAFSTIAANTTGTVNYGNTGDLTVGVVNFTGIASGNSDVLLNTTGNLTVAQSINAGTGNVLLGAGATVTETTGAVTALGLAVVSGNTPTLNLSNAITNLAAQITNSGQAFNFTSNKSFTVNSVAGVNGITTNDGDVNLLANVGDLNVDAAIAAGKGAVQLTSLSGAVTESGGAGPVPAGEVTANTLLVQAANTSMLTGNNDVNRVAAVITGNGSAFGFSNTSDLTVGIASGISGITTNAGDIDLSSGGSLTLNQQVDAAGANVRLVSNGNMTQAGSGIITANTLGVRNLSTTGGDITLTLGNSFTTVGGFNAFSGGALLLVDANGATIGRTSPFSNGNFNFVATNGLTGTGAANVGLSAAGAISINQPINDLGGTVYLDSNGGISQTATIAAGTLGVRNEDPTGGSITLTLAGNQIGAIAAQDLDADSNGLAIYSSFAGTTTVTTLQAFSNGGFSFAKTNGVSTAGNEDILLGSGGILNVDAPINAGQGTVRLVAATGIGQNSAGVITASGLGASNTGASGDIDLSVAANQIGTGVTAGLVAASNAAPDGAIKISDANAAGMLVSSIIAASSGALAFADSAGVTTTNGATSSNDITLTALGGLTLQQNVTAPNADVLLQGSLVAETTGIVQANGLAVVSTFSPLLANNNAVNVIAANVKGFGQSFTYLNLGPVTVGDVLGVSGITTINGSVLVDTLAGDLTLQSNVSAGTADVQLVAAGSVTESGGAIKAGSLLVSAQGASVLGGANTVSTLAAEISGAGDFTFANTGNLTIGTVDGISGISTIGGSAINVQSGGSLSITQALNAGFGVGTIRLGSNGNLFQSGSGLITANKLVLRNDSATSGNIVLTLGVSGNPLASNRFNALAASNAFSGGSIFVLNGGTVGLAIVSDAGLAAGTNFNFGATNGLSATGNATVAVQTPAALLVAAPINVPNGTVYLDASGDITQTGAGTITAAAVELRNESTTGGAINLGLANDIGTLAAFNNYGGAGITVGDTGASNLTIGSLGPVANGSLSIAGASGVATTNSQDIGLESGGSLTITQAINAGFGTVRLVSNGDMTQSGAGLINALDLGVQNQSAVSGDIMLTLQNIVPIVAASNAAAGGKVVIVSGDSLGLFVRSVSAASNGSFNFTGANGVTANGNALVALQSAAGITLNDPISNAGGTVLLEAHNAVSQSAGGTITATTLGVRDDGIFGDIVLTQNNSIGSFSAFNAVNGGQIILYQGSAGVLSIDATSAPSLGGAFNYGATIGVSTTGGGDIGLESGGGLTLNQTVDAGSGTVRLVSNGDVTQAGAGIISAGSLGVENLSVTGGGIVLNGANQIGALAALNDSPGGALTVNNASDLTVGSVGALASGNFNFSALSGVATTSGGGAPGTNVVQLSSAGTLTLTQDVSAPTSDVFLTAGNTILQTGGGITADGLGITAVNSPTLNGAANNVNVIAATITGPGQSFSYQNVGPLSVGTVGVIVGVTTNSGAVTLGSANGDLTLTNNIVAGTANVRLEAPQGAVLEAGGAVDAGGLAVIALNAPVLTGANSVKTIAAQVTGLNQGFSFTQSGGFAVGSVSGVDGITTNNGPITLTAQTGSITLQKNVNAGSGNVILTAQAGRLLESGGGVQALSLQATAVSGINLGGPNAVGQLQATDTGTGGIIFKNSAPNLKVTGLMAIGSGNILLQTNGNLAVNGVVSTGAGSIALVSGGTDTVNADVSAGAGSVTFTTSAPGADILVNGDVSASGGDVSATAARNVILNNGSLTASSAVHLNAISGEIHGAGSGTINASSLFTSSATGTDLENTNTVSVFNGMDSSGGIQFVGSAGLLDVTGITEGSGSVVIKNVGGLTVSGPLNSGNGIDLVVTGGRSNVLVDAKVNAGGLFQVTTPANVYFATDDKAAAIKVSGETIEAAGNLIAAAGDLSLNASDVLYLEGTTYSGTNVLLNTALPQARVLAPQATIIVTDPTTVTINAGNSFAVGYLENLMAFGSLTINAKTATVGDTAARGALDIFANDVTLMDRQPDGFSFDGRHDQGLSFVANSIDFGGASVSFSGQGNHQAFFSVNTGLPNVDRINGTTFYVDAEEDNQFQQATGAPGGHFTEGGTVSLASLPLQPIAGGVIDAEVVAVLAGSLPSIKFSDPTPEIRLSAAAIKKFTGLGVNSRDPDEEEKKGIKAKKALFKQLFKTLAPPDSDYQVVVNRIAAGQVYKVLDTYNRIVGQNLELVPKIKDVLSTQYSKYVGNGDIINAAGFDDYLVANQKKDAQARDAIAILGQVRELFGELGRIGLTTKELEICEDVIWRSLDIDDFTESDFLIFVGTPHRNFAPPTPPAPAAPPAPAPAPAPGPTTAALSDRPDRL